MISLRSHFSRVARTLVVAVCGLIVTSFSAAAQSHIDSIAAWTRTLQTGTLQQRAEAVDMITNDSVASLPPATQDALVQELVRVHADLARGWVVDPEDRGELFTDYYMNLVSSVVQLKTDEATMALIPAAGVSGGIQRRVAKLGDRTVDTIMPLIERQHEVPALLETLGFVWSWSDSAHASLSERSRARIVSAVVLAAQSDSSQFWMGARGTMEHAADPAFLPLALAMVERLDTLGGDGTFIATMLKSSAIPSMTKVAAARSTSDLATGALRMTIALCAPADGTGRARGASCAELANQFEAAVRHIEGGRTTAAQSVLTALSSRIEREYAANRLSFSEHSLLAGNVHMLLERIAPEAKSNPSIR